MTAERSAAERPATPRSLGYGMPAEWEEQSSIWLSWPTNGETWPDALLDRVREAYVRIIVALSADQGVDLLVDDPETAASVRERLDASGARGKPVRFHTIRTVDAWIRDYGPTFVRNDTTGRLAMVHWKFNAWGGKYLDLAADTAVPEVLSRNLDMPVFRPGVVMEGGSFDVDGEGTALTTEQCLLNPNRNPDLDRAGLESVLADCLGVSKVVWLGEGIVGDDTDGHVDDIARFTRPAAILAAYEDDPKDENHPILDDNWKRLVAARDARGRVFDVRRLPMPDPVVGPEGRLPASYANFYIGNRSVIVPIFGQKHKDRIALDTIRSEFPNHHVVGVDAVAMVHGLGAVHCCSQQQPAPRRSERSGLRGEAERVAALLRPADGDDPGRYGLDA